MSVDVLECIQQRRSIREFQPTPIPPDVLTKLVEAAAWAPSAGNWQSWRFVVVLRKELRDGLVVASNGQDFLEQAPAIIVVCAEPDRAAHHYGERARDLYCLQDTAAAIQNLLLAAHALGLGACWVGDYEEDKVQKLLKLDPSFRPIALIPVGYPNEHPSPRWRRPLSEVMEILG